MSKTNTNQTAIDLYMEKVYVWIMLIVTGAVTCAGITFATEKSKEDEKEGCGIQSQKRTCTRTERLGVREESFGV